MTPDGSTLYLAGRGAGAASWVLSAGVKRQNLQTAFTADKGQVLNKEPGHRDRHPRMSQHLAARFANTCDFAFAARGSITSC